MTKCKCLITCNTLGLTLCKMEKLIPALPLPEDSMCNEWKCPISDLCPQMCLVFGHGPSLPLSANFPNPQQLR